MLLFLCIFYHAVTIQSCTNLILRFCCRIVNKHSLTISLKTCSHSIHFYHHYRVSSAMYITKLSQIVIKTTANIECLPAIFQCLSAILTQEWGDDVSHHLDWGGAVVSGSYWNIGCKHSILAVALMKISDNLVIYTDDETLFKLMFIQNIDKEGCRRSDFGSKHPLKWPDIATICEWTTLQGAGYYIEQQQTMYNS